MRISDILYEMPMIHSDLDSHELSTKDGNLMYFRRYEKGAELVSDLGGGVGVYHSDRGNPTYLVLDHERQRVLYYMQYVPSNNRQLGKYVYQKFLWIDKGSRGTVGYLPTHYFYQLVDEFGMVVTDSEQTSDGRRFWEKRIADAFGRGLRVYYHDFKTSELVKLHTVSDVSEYDHKYAIYSDNESALDRVFVITSRELTDVGAANPVKKPSTFSGLRV